MISTETQSNMELQYCTFTANQVSLRCAVLFHCCVTVCIYPPGRCCLTASAVNDSPSYALYKGACAITVSSQKISANS